MRDKDSLMLEKLYSSIYQAHDLLLESDFRGVIKKQLGMTQQMADYLHNLDPQKNSDKYSQWFATRIRKLPGYNEAEDKLKFIERLKPDMEHILNFFESEKDFPIFDYTWEQALRGDYRPLYKKKGFEEGLIEHLHNDYLNYQKILALLKPVSEFKAAPDKLRWFRETYEDGISDEVKNYFVDHVGVYAPWFMGQVKQLSNFKSATNKISFIEAYLQRDIGLIQDYLGNHPTVNPYTLQYFERSGTPWQQLVAKSQAWHREMEEAGRDEDFHDKQRQLPGDENRPKVLEFEDGYYWINHQSPNSTEESNLMGHCGSDSRSEDGKVISDLTLISLRKYFPNKAARKGFCTITISPDRHTWYQAKGPKNSKPKEIYGKYIAAILDHYKIYNYSGGYANDRDFHPQDYIQAVNDYPYEFPKANEIVKKIEKFAGAQLLKDQLKKLNANFSAGAFENLDEETKLFYFDLGYEINDEAYNNLADNLKEVYLDAIASDSSRSMRYVEKLLSSGMKLKDVPVRFIQGINLNPSNSESFLRTVLRGTNDDFSQVPENMYSLIIGNPDPSEDTPEAAEGRKENKTGSPDLSFKFFRYLMNRNTPFDQINPQMIKTALRSTQNLIPLSRLIIDNNLKDEVMGIKDKRLKTLKSTLLASEKILKIAKSKINPS